MKRRAFLTGAAALFCFPKSGNAMTNPEFDSHVGFRYVIAYRNEKPTKGTLFVPKKVIDSVWVYPIEIRGQQVNSPREYALDHFEAVLQGNPDDIVSVTVQDGDYLFTQYQNSRDWGLLPWHEI